MAQSRTVQKLNQKAFAILFQNSYDAVAIHSIGDEGKLMDVNETFCRLLHFKRQELLRLHFLDLTAPEYRESLAETFEKISREDAAVHEICLLSRNSDRIMMEFNSHFLEYLGRPAVLSIGRDLSLIKRAAKIQSAVYRISEAAYQNKTMPELFESIHRIIGELVPAKNFYIALYDFKRDQITFPYFVDEKDAAHSARKGGRGLTEYVLRTGEPLVASIPEMRELEERGEVDLIGAPCAYWLGVPLKIQSSIIGAIVLQSYTEDFRLGDEEKKMLVFVSTQVAMSIERKRSEEAIRKSEERYRVFLEQSTEAIWRIELSEPVPVHLSEEEQIDRIYRYGFLAECNNTMAHQYGFQTADQLLGAKLGDMLVRSDQHNLDILRAFIRSGYRLSDAETHEVDNQGRPKFFLNNLIGYVKDGLLYHAWGTQRDVTERKQTMEQLKASEERHRLLFERNLAGVYRTNADGRILDCNDSFARILGYDSRHELMSMVSWELYCHPDDREKFLRELMKNQALTNFEIRLRKRDGSVIWALENVTYLPAATAQESIIEGTLIDITDRKKAEEQIAFQAYHDPLTGLPNRNLFRDRLSQALSTAVRHDQGLAILFLDLDRFKLINDTLGHSVGDWLLKQVAERLRGCVRESDTVARLGGDEFILYLNEISQSESAARVAQKILEIIAEPFFHDGQELYVTTSIGISVFPADGEDVDTLIKSADSAMYLAKDSGRNNYQLSSPSLNILAHERLLMERNLRQAVERNEFVLFYQPQFHLRTGGVTGVEALIRWNHPDKGLVAPEEFISLAEESRLIFPIGEWALWEACKQLRVWHLEGFSQLSMSANLSAKQFQHQNLADYVEHILFETGLNPSSLILEITETVAMQNVERTVRILRKLRNIGVRIALDDFGTGYSSLSYLKYFPIDIIKIDPSFVRNVGRGLHEEALVRAVIHLGHSLKRKVVAEGVETEMQRVFLKYEGCEEVQGFLFSPPLPAEEISGLIRRHRV